MLILANINDQDMVFDLIHREDGSGFGKNVIIFGTEFI